MVECRLSVIVPACNAAPFLDRCLGAILAERGPSFEVILVDDGSTDGTPELAEALGVQVVRQHGNGGPSRARNVGARKAKGEYLLFVDSDIIVHAGTFAQVCAVLDAEPGVAALFGSYDETPAAKGVVTEYRNLLHHFTHQHGRREASTFWSGCGAVRREVFLALGGFDERAFPRSIEDIELGYRLRDAGHKVLLVREILCTHMKRWTLYSMVKTDVFGRAVPWARLMIGRKVAPDDLNIKKAQKLCVLLTGLALLSLAGLTLSPWSLVPLLLSVLLVVALNGSLFGLLARTHGALFAINCVPLHLLYYTYSGMAYAYVRVFSALGLPLWDSNSVHTIEPAPGPMRPVDRDL